MKAELAEDLDLIAQLVALPPDVLQWVGMRGRGALPTGPMRWYGRSPS